MARTLSTLLAPVLDYVLEEIHPAFPDLPLKYKDASSLQRFAFWMIVNFGSATIVISGMAVAAVIFSILQALWFASPGECLFIIIIMSLVGLLTWLVRIDPEEKK